MKTIPVVEVTDKDDIVHYVAISHIIEVIYDFEKIEGKEGNYNKMILSNGIEIIYDPDGNHNDSEIQKVCSVLRDFEDYPEEN